MKIELKKEHKKAAIVSLGTRISIDAKNIRSIDLFYLREYLINVLGRDCDFVSGKIKSDNNRDYFKEIAETDLNDYDEVWIYNATLNAFGGYIFTWTIKTFEKLCDFKGDIYYMLIDPSMPNNNIAKLIEKKLKDGKVPTESKETPFYAIDTAKLEKYTKEVWPRIITAFDGLNYDNYIKLWREKHTDKDNIKKLYDSDWCTLPLAEYYSVNENLDLKLENYDFSYKRYDLIYYGNNRHTSRGLLISNLYDNSDFNVFIAGYDPEFKNATYKFSEYVDHDRLFPLICSSYATIVCGDDLHNDNIMTVRFFEAMLLDTVAFIHNSYDSEHKYILNKELADFIYVDNTDDIKDRLDKIKNDETLYRKIVELERKEIFDQFGQYKMNIVHPKEKNKIIELF